MTRYILLLCVTALVVTNISCLQEVSSLVTRCYDCASGNSVLLDHNCRQVACGYDHSDDCASVEIDVVADVNENSARCYSCRGRSRVVCFDMYIV